MTIYRVGNFYVAARRKGIAVLRVANPDVAPRSTRGRGVTKVAEYPVAHWGRERAVRAAVKAATRFTIMEL